MPENLGHCIEKRRKTLITEKYVKFKDNRKFEAYFVQMTEMSQWKNSPQHTSKHGHRRLLSWHLERITKNLHKQN